MTTKKPLAEWTLGELKEHCTAEGDCRKPIVCRFFNPEEGGCSISHDTPNLWDLTEKPRFTEDEVATMRVLYAAGARHMARDTEGPLYWYENEPEEPVGGVWQSGDGGFGKLPDNLFPSLLPGQSVTIADIIKN